MAAQVIFVLIVLIGACYFFLTRRSFDLFLIAYCGAIFYFAPLFIGFVRKDFYVAGDYEALPFGIYLIGSSIFICLAVGAFIFDSTYPNASIDASGRYGKGLNVWYLLLAAVGFIGAGLTGDIFNLDKLALLDQLGYWFVLFETATAMAVVDAVWYRKKWPLFFGVSFLLIDLLIGFRMTTVMVVLCSILLTFGVRGPIHVWKRAPQLSAIFGIFVLVMLFINPLRYAVLPAVGHLIAESSLKKSMTRSAVTETEGVRGAQSSNRKTSEERVEIPAPSIQTEPRSDIDKSQNLRKAPSKDERNAAAPPPVLAEPISEGLSRVFSTIPEVLNTEPFVTQSILSKMIERNFSCAPTRLLNIIYVVPFMGFVVGYPSTLESQFKPVLFPNEKYGMAGNIWAEMFCQFDYWGPLLAAIVFVVIIASMQVLLFKRLGSFVPAIALAGVFLTFYVHRNDFLFELLLIRRVLMVFVVAWFAKMLYRNLFSWAGFQP